MFIIIYNQIVQIILLNDFQSCTHYSHNLERKIKIISYFISWKVVITYAGMFCIPSSNFIYFLMAA